MELKVPVFVVIFMTHLQTPSKPLNASASLTAKKNDLVLWCYLSEVQVELYEKFLSTEEFATVGERSSVRFFFLSSSLRH
jgi:hypothetical protein